MTKCYSVRLELFYSISSKCYKALAFNGSEALIPASQYFGQDHSVSKSDSYWISAWILEKKELQYSIKKWTNFSKAGKNIGKIEFKHHKPKKLDKTNIKHDTSLTRTTEDS